MTTGSSSYNRVAFVKDGWTYYDYGNRSWAGGDTPPSQRPKDRVKKSFSFYVTEVVNGHKVPKLVTVERTRLVPKRSQALPPHNFTKNGKDFKQDWFRVSWSNGASAENGGLINELPFTSSWSTNDDIALLSKLRSDIAGSDFNLGVSLAEAPKALSMITEHARRMAAFTRHFKKGNFRRASHELFSGRKLQSPSKAASSNWLALKYGWLPLLKDTYDGAQFLAHNFNSPRVFRVACTRSLGKKGDSSYDFPYWGLRDGVSYVMANMERKESKRIVAIMTEVNVPKLSGIEDPLSIAWELVPYSFVVDWFIPVGNWLSARGLSQSLTGVFITSYVHKERLNYLWIKNNSNWGFGFSKRIDRGEWSRFSFSRSISTTLPVPLNPVVKSLESIPSWGRAVTALALLVQKR